ncbi:MAG: hypothetical protein MJ068_04870 [Clostridia bacterium]|nr:hypothetical protein [Clostridia bacterium]
MAKEKETKTSKQVKAPQANQKVRTNKLELLITVVPKGKTESFQDMLQAYEANLQMAIRGLGTAKDQILTLLGTDSLKKGVIFSVIKEERVQDALAALEDRFARLTDGKGVAFTIPMTSVIGVASFGFLANNRKTVKEQQ